MQQSETLYYQEPYLRQIPVSIIAMTTYQQRTAVITDQTICYPEGGGQPGDRGLLGGVPIIDMQKDDQGKILHVLGSKAPFSPQDTVLLVLDWQHRYDFMQQHTAQHLISGTLYRLLGIGTLSVHFGEKEMSVEIDRSSISEDEVAAVEDEVNRIVCQCVPVSSETMSLEKAQALGLRRPIQVFSPVRIVRIGSYDAIACGGLHVSDSAQIRLVQWVRNERIRGRLRTFWVAGDRAIKVIRNNREVVEKLKSSLCAPVEEIAEQVDSLQRQLADARYEFNEVVDHLAALKLESAIKEAVHVDGIAIVTLDLSAERADMLKRLAKAILPIDALALFAIQKRDDGNLAWMIALKGPFAVDHLFASLQRSVLPRIGAKGGGKAPLWQGIGNSPAAGEEAMRDFSFIVTEALNAKEK